MFAIPHALGMFVVDLFKSRNRLEAENLFLRHQLAIALRRAHLVFDCVAEIARCSYGWPGSGRVLLVRPRWCNRIPGLCSFKRGQLINCSLVTSDAGLFTYRELDDAIGRLRLFSRLVATLVDGPFGKCSTIGAFADRVTSIAAVNRRAGGAATGSRRSSPYIFRPITKTN
jgi:hypothetical protein